MCTHRYNTNAYYTCRGGESEGERKARSLGHPLPLSLSLFVFLASSLESVSPPPPPPLRKNVSSIGIDHGKERDRGGGGTRRGEGGGQTSPPYSPSALRARSRTYFFSRYIPGGAPSRSCALSSWRFLDLIFILSLSAGPRYPPAASRSFSLSLSLSPYYVCSVLAQFPEPPFPSTSASTSPPPSARVRIYSRSSPHSIVSVSLPTSLLAHSLSHFAYARYTLLLVCSAQQLLQQQQQQQQRVQRENEKERQLGVYIYRGRGGETFNIFVRLPRRVSCTGCCRCFCLGWCVCARTLMLPSAVSASIYSLCWNEESLCVCVAEMKVEIAGGL